MLSKQPVYSPTQAACGTLLGGPAAAVYFIYSNYRAFDDRPGMKKTLLFGALFFVLLVMLITMLPGKSHNYGLSAAIAVAARHFVETGQISKSDIENSPHYQFRSNWMVVLMGLLMLGVSFVLAFLLFVLLVGMGFPVR